MATSYLVSVESSPQRIMGARCFIATAAGAPIPTAYTGVVGGAVLAELNARRSGQGSSLTMLPAGLGWGAVFGGELPIAPNVDTNYTIWCIDPAGSDVDPWPTIAAIAAEIAP